MRGGPIANPDRGETTLNLDRPRRFRLDFNAYKAFEHRFDVNFLADIQAVLTGLSITQLTYLVWLGIHLDDPDVTEEQVGSWLDFGKISEVVAAVTRSFEHAQAAMGNPGGPAATTAPAPDQQPRPKVLAGTELADRVEALESQASVTGANSSDIHDRALRNPSPGSG